MGILQQLTGQIGGKIRVLARPSEVTSMPANTQRLEILNGWKEIANYVGKGIRTVQRYERELGLPVRRNAGKSTGSVIATKAEIDAWISARPLREELRRPLSAMDNAEMLKRLGQRVAEMQRLNKEMIASRAALRAAIKLLRESIQITHTQFSSTRGTPDVLTLDPKRKVN